MRPERFHPGNDCYFIRQLRGKGDFNEAGAFPPRKFCLRSEEKEPDLVTSMRPERFHPGNQSHIHYRATPYLTSMRPERFHPGNAFRDLRRRVLGRLQ